MHSCSLIHGVCIFAIFFFNDTATTEIYTLSLHDALPICEADLADLRVLQELVGDLLGRPHDEVGHASGQPGDRKSTRLNSSHSQISYAVFCLKKKNSNSLGPVDG